MLWLWGDCKSLLDSELPTVMIGVPTGFTKAYASLLMLATLQDIDYPPEKLKLTFAVTLIKNHPHANHYLQRLKTLVEAAELPYPTNIITVTPTDEDYYRWGFYFGIVTNLHRLRCDFLASNYDRFWLLGGDNPPQRGTLKKLVNLNVDVASGKIRQRPAKIRDNIDHSAPIVLWRNYWHMCDVDRGLEPILREELRKAWIDYGFLKVPDNSTFRKRRVKDCLFGSGCSLIKRKVFMRLGYALGHAGIHSEDLHFCLLSQLNGFSTAMDLTARCGHYDTDGQIY